MFFVHNKYTIVVKWNFVEYFDPCLHLGPKHASKYMNKYALHMSVYMVCTMGTLLKPKYYVVVYDSAKSTNFVHGASIVGIYHYQRCIRPPRLMMLASTLLLSSLLLILDRAEGGNFWPRKQHFDSTVNF